MIHKLLLLCPVVALTACGGGTTIKTQPISSLGFADGTDIETVDDITFTVQDQQLIVRTDGNNPNFSRQTIEVFYDPDGDTQTLTIDGTIYELTENPQDQDEFVRLTPNEDIEVEIFANASDAYAVEVFAVVDGVLTDGYAILGLDTDPATVNAASRTATYVGEVDASLRRGDFLDAFGSGEATITVNFEEGTLSGSTILSQDDPDDAEFNFPNLNLTFEESDIAENGFAGELSVDDGGLGGVQVQGGYDGRFFGEDAETVGGTFYSQVAVDAFPDDMFITGYFLTEESDE